MNSLIKERLEKIERGIVPGGYKKTRIGIIPEDWEVKKLDEISNNISSGKTKNKEDVGSYPIYGSTGVIGYSDKYDYEGIKILIARVGANAGLINIVAGKYGVSDNTLILDLKTNNIKYIYYYLILFNLNKLVFGTGQPLITGGEVKELKIPTPTLQEQEEIANILSTWDKAIENIEKLIKEKEIQKKGLMQELLTGKTRLPGFDGEWEQIKLGEVTERVVEKNEGKTSNVLTISADYGLVNQEEYFTKQIASKNLDSYTYLTKGEFAYNKSYSKGYPMGAIKMLELYEDGVVSSLYICFRAKNNIDVNYLKQYFDANMFSHEIFKVAQEGARNHGLLNIGIKDFFNIKLPVAPFPEQKSIAEILSTADKEIELLNQLLENKKEEKKGLMQLLLTGIVRV